MSSEQAVSHYQPYSIS